MTYKLNFFIFLVLLALTSLLWAFLKGSTPIPLDQLIKAFHHASIKQYHDILFAVRLPRVLSGFVVGGLLALAGGLMQILLRNPLADPYVLGISGGASVVTLCLVLIGLQGLALTLGAWVGGLTAILLVFFLTHSQHGLNNQRMLLTGVACASGFSAIMSFILLISPDKELHGMLFWLMGDLSYTHLPLLEASLLLIGVILSIWFAPQLNILLRGEKEAHTLGVNIHYLKLFLYFMSAGLTATAVTLAGCVGFIGLIVPHLLRLAGINDQRFLLPSAVLLGGSLLTIADTLARTMMNPIQLPVGIVTTMLGVPIFLWLLSKP